MKKLLITKRLTALLWTLVLALMPMSLMADNTPLSVTVKKQSGGNIDERADKAFDGITTNKWCGNIPTATGINPFVEVQLAEPSNLDYYYLYTGNDINYQNDEGKQQRNPKEWKLYAKVNEGDDWKLISHVTDAGLPTTVSTRSNNYKIDAANQNIEYNYLKFEILQIEQGNIFEVGEICFVNCTNHSGELVPEVPATCTEAGRKAYRICTECGKRVDVNGNELTDDDMVIPAAGHTFGETIPAKDPTCTEGGNIAYHKCTACNKYFDMNGKELSVGGWVRNALGHAGEWKITIEATCTEGGETGLHCERCGNIVSREPTKPLGHIPDEGVVTKEPTCSETGIMTHTCSRCQETYTEDIKTTLHNIDDNLKCTVCGHEITADCIIEYTATEKLSIVINVPSGLEIPNEYDYTDKFPPLLLEEFKDFENLGEYFFGASPIKHDYDETTHKGRIICNAPVTQFDRFTDLRRDRLTSITLPSTVTYIGYPFDDCSNLTSITLLAEYSDKLEYHLDLEGCNNLQEIIVPYNSYADYVEAYKDSYCRYYEGDGMRVNAPTRFYFKSLLSLDDTKDFQTPEIVVKVDATLQRSFSNDGWYSLCLPFSVFVQNTPFSQVAEFSEIDGDTYKFTTVDFIMDAGTPYIVKVDAAVSNPIFEDVFITTVAPATDGAFIGVYSPTELGAGCKVIGSGTTVNPVNPGKMKGFRAYFPASAAGAKAMRFTVDDGEATSIQSLTEAEGNKLKAEGTFNLAGQKVDENYRGIVIKNGKKYLNK